MAELRETKEVHAVLSFPVEIFSNILARLTVKDLMRFKSVCKSWYVLISSSHFANLHHLNSLSSDDHARILFSPGNDGCLYFSDIDEEKHKSPITRKLNIDLGFSFNNIVNSCNGLLLCTCNDDPCNPTLILLNPSTLIHRRIPKIELPPNHSAQNFGFGYDSTANDYKILMRIAIILDKYDGVEKIGEMMLYSFNADSWKLIPENFPAKVANNIHAPWNGALVDNHLLHWLFWDLPHLRLRSFDVCSEKWSVVPLPDHLAGDHWTMIPVDLGVLDGHLCLMAYEFKWKWSVLVMKEYGVQDSWVNLLDDFDMKSIGSGAAFPLVYSESGSEILLITKKYSSFCWYDSTQKIIREAGIHNVSDPYAQRIVCVQNLVPLPGCDQSIKFLEVQ